MNNFQIISSEWNWFNTKLLVDHYPLPGEILKFKDIDYIINVSDEYISYCHTAAIQNNIKYFWFPLNECQGDMGLNSIFGALNILHAAEQENKKVLIHCHAGINRSRTVVHAYHFMKKGFHLQSEFYDIMIDKNNENFKRNSLLDNIKQGYLPSLEQMEKFLKELYLQLSILEETNRGGNLDLCKIHALR